MRNGIKGRNRKTYSSKIRKLTKIYNSCPKIKEKYSLDQWTEKVKKPNISKSGLI